MNFIEILGHLGSDPETRVTPNGVKITTFRMATNSRRAGKDETVWWRVTVFGDKFEKMMPHLKKGSALIVMGELNKPEIWMDKEGRPQVTLEIVAEMLRFSPFGRTDRSQENTGGHSYGATQQQPYSNAQHTYQAPQQQSHSHSSNYAQPNYGYQEQPSFGEPNFQSPGSFSANNQSHNDEEIPF